MHHPVCITQLLMQVCNLLQIEASRISIGPSWEPVLQRAVHRAAAALGLKEGAARSIKPHLQQLLLCEEGGQVADGKEMDSAPGMFAALLVQLPCIGGHEGGKLVVQHGGRSYQHELAQVMLASWHQAIYAMLGMPSRP